jgi:hypothetical protein
VVGEDVEDHGGAVDHRHAERLFEVTFLSRRELVVGRDEVRAGAVDRLLELLQLAAAEVAVRVGLLTGLHHLPGRRDAGRTQELLELVEEPLGVAAGRDPDG